MSDQRQPDDPEDAAEQPDDVEDHDHPRLTRSPSPVAWSDLAQDLFDRVVVHVRRALRDLDDADVTPTLRRLRSVPSQKLRRGAGRRQLTAELSADGPLWIAVRKRVQRDGDLAARLARALDRHDPDKPTEDGGTDDDARLRMDRDRARRQRDDAMAQRDETLARLDEARQERDAAVRAHDGARGREAGLREQVDVLSETVAAQRDELGDLRARVDQHETERREVVERERRRAASEREDLDRQLSDARRELDEARRTVKTLTARLRARDEPSAPTSPDPGSGTTAVVPGRPSRLPGDLRTDTVEGARELLAPGRRVYVDGYNVTRTHHGDVDLEHQRSWLVDAVAGLAARLDLDVTVVFDAQSGRRASRQRQRAGVHVQFTHPGTTADDELVFAVEALPPDEPVVVVTDDAALRRRLDEHDVDLLHTTVFKGLL